MLSTGAAWASAVNTLARMVERANFLEKENERLRQALQWYEERARLGRMTDDASGSARYEMIQDGGSIARAALQPKE